MKFDWYNIEQDKNTLARIKKSYRIFTKVISLWKFVKTSSPDPLRKEEILIAQVIKRFEEKFTCN